MTDLPRNLDVLETCGAAVAGLERQIESIPLAIADGKGGKAKGKGHKGYKIKKTQYYFFWPWNKSKFL